MTINDLQRENVRLKQKVKILELLFAAAAGIAGGLFLVNYIM